jgi:hypothetical protein
MPEKRSAYVEFDRSEDFGLTGLAEVLRSLGRHAAQADALEVVAWLADQSGQVDDVRLLLAATGT